MDLVATGALVERATALRAPQAEHLEALWIAADPNATPVQLDRARELLEARAANPVAVVDLLRFVAPRLPDREADASLRVSTLAAVPTQPEAAGWVERLRQESAPD